MLRFFKDTNQRCFFCSPVVAVCVILLVEFKQISLTSAEEGPYCGIYAIYGAAATLGPTPDFERLVDKQFVTSFAGSGASDLLKAADSIGVRATALHGLGPASLKHAQDPLILHVASRGQLEAYNHWVLFLGMEDNNARIVDGTATVQLLPISQLLARWDGVALAIYLGDSPKSNYSAIETATFGWWGLFSISLVLGTASFANCLLGRSAELSRTWVTLLLLTSLITLLVRELFGETSFSKNADSIKYIIAAEGGRSYEEITVEELVKIVSKPSETMVFDTRYADSYARGHLPYTRNLPIDAKHDAITRMTADLRRTCPIVLYCQSAGCGYSDRMAIVLTGLGFENIRIYREGWVGWKSYWLAQKSPINSPK
jgi:rhodanese-related sulfurtransferase